MIDVTSLSAYDLSQKLHSGEISSLDLCKAYLDRIKKFEKDVQAWQFLDKKLLLEKAEEADTYRKSGKPLGPLHGMPVAIKDIIGTYDMPTECGTVFRKKMSNSQDSEIVNLLKNAGAIIMGKTVTCELDFFFLNTVPHSVGISYVPIISFIAIGMPCRAPKGFPDFL